MEPLSDPRADDLCCDQQRHGGAGEVSSPAAREACGPPAPGAHACEVSPECVEAGRCSLFICAQHSVLGHGE
eukprot:1482110-Alexandrium_andersonii.AAC.1